MTLLSAGFDGLMHMTGHWLTVDRCDTVSYSLEGQPRVAHRVVAVGFLRAEREKNPTPQGPFQATAYITFAPLVKARPTAKLRHKVWRKTSPLNGGNSKVTL